MLGRGPAGAGAAFPIRLDLGSRGRVGHAGHLLVFSCVVRCPSGATCRGPCPLELFFSVPSPAVRRAATPGDARLEPPNRESGVQHKTARASPTGGLLTARMGATSGGEDKRQGNGVYAES